MRFTPYGAVSHFMEQFCTLWYSFTLCGGTVSYLVIERFTPFFVINIFRLDLPVSEIDLRSLGLVLAVEELGQGALLDGVYGVVVEPRRVRRDHDVVRLVGHVVF